MRDDNTAPIGSAHGLPFNIDVEGTFSPEHLHVQYTEIPRPSTPELQTLIEDEWSRRLAEAADTNRILFNGPLLRYVSHEIRPALDEGADDFHLTVGPTCYRDFVGTNLFNNHRLAEFGWHTFANPIGTTATLITSDDLICYGLRSSRVAYHARHVHTFGGSLEAGDRRSDGTVDPFGSLTREIVEELNVQPDEIHGLICAGLLRDKEIHQPELLFEAEVDLTAAELRERWKAAESKDEHEALATLHDDPEAIVPFIRSCGLIAPVAIGGLFLHGRLRWGQAWFEAAAAKFLD